MLPERLRWVKIKLDDHRKGWGAFCFVLYYVGYKWLTCDQNESLWIWITLEPTYRRSYLKQYRNAYSSATNLNCDNFKYVTVPYWLVGWFWMPHYNHTIVLTCLFVSCVVIERHMGIRKKGPYGHWFQKYLENSWESIFIRIGNRSHPSGMAWLLDMARLTLGKHNDWTRLF